MITDISQFVAERDQGGIVEIDPELWYYFLEVLPPPLMNTKVKMPDGRQQSVAFCFAEGWENLTAFWTEGKGESKRYLAQLTTILNPNRW
jgi:hypothetical protein